MAALLAPAPPLVIVLIVLAGDVPVRLAAADVVQDRTRHLRLPAEAVLRRRRSRTTPALWDGDLSAARSSTAPSSASSRPVLAMLIGVPGAYALSRTTIKAEEPAVALDPGLAHGAADRLHDPLFPGLSSHRADRHADRPGHHLPDLQPVAGGLDDALASSTRRRARWRRPPGSTAPVLWQALLPDRAAAVGAGPRRDRDPLLPLLPGTTSSSP